MTLKARGQLILIQKLIDEAVSIYNNIDLDEQIKIMYSCETIEGLNISILLADTKNTVTELIDNAQVETSL